MRREIPALLLVGALAQACSCDSVPDAALTSCELNQVVQGAVQTDILFVVDDSGSMDEEQANLRDNLSTFISTLQGSPVANDFRIGVTTTSVSSFPDNAATGLQGCLIGPWLEGGSPALLADFQAQIDAVGTSGSGKEQPFRAMELALTTPGLAGCLNNAGFLRPGSRLAVVFLSDEDDCSDAANGADSNRECHNDAGDGVDYKFTRIDSIDHYAAFLQGSIGGERRDVILASIVGVDAVTTAPTCGFDATLPNGWCCGSPLLDEAATCPVGPPACGSRTVTNAGLVGDTYCCGTAGTPYCASSCSTAYDKADRFAALLARFPSSRRLVASVCDASFASSLEQIAGLIISPTVPLEGEPADYRMMIVGLRAPDGSRVACTVALEGTPEAATADAVYAPAQGSSPATLTFPDTGGCALSGGYRIELDIICAG